MYVTSLWIASLTEGAQRAHKGGVWRGCTKVHDILASIPHIISCHEGSAWRSYEGAVQGGMVTGGGHRRGHGILARMSHVILHWILYRGCTRGTWRGFMKGCVCKGCVFKGGAWDSTHSSFRTASCCCCAGFRDTEKPEESAHFHANETYSHEKEVNHKQDLAQLGMFYFGLINMIILCALQKYLLLSVWFMR